MANLIIMQPTDGRSIQALSDTITFKLTSEQTDNTLTAFLNVTPPGGGPPPHTHAKEDELFIILEGTFSFFANDRWTDVGPGGLVYIPRLCLHTYRNSSNEVAKAMILTTPGGFEHFLTDLSAACPADQPVDTKRLVETSAKHGIVFPGLG